MTKIVVPFHSGDQFSAQLLLENILSFDSGMDDRLSFRLQFDRPKSECRILDTIARLADRFDVEFAEVLPPVPVPDAFRENDPNSTRVDDKHTVRTPETKERILSWNRAVYAAIHDFDRFAIIEPDCIILKHDWAKDIFDAADEGLKHFPIFGHLKTGLIGGQKIPTHYAGCSVYDGAGLRQLITDEVFQTRYPNPWWDLRHNEPSELAGNCFWGPDFSGFDISFDYFLYAHLQRDRHAHAHPLDWKTSDLPNAGDVIKCDFHSRKTMDEIFSAYYGRQPVIHGIKDDAVRHAVIKRARSGLAYPGFALSGKDLAPPYRRDEQALVVQVPSQAPESIGRHNDRFCTLEGLQNRYKGERVFLMANGPSLKRTDLTKLKDEYTIGLNRIGLNLENMGFEPTFLCCVNGNVLEQFSEDFDRASSLKFLSASSKDAIRNTWNTFFMGSVPKVGYFEKDLRSEEWCEGWTVTYCAMQVAYFLGFEEVVLVGLDHYFKDSGAANKAVVADAPDENHFHPAYFGKGVTWQYPDLDRSEQHYLVARQTFEEDGRRILDATLGGHCEIFEKADFQSFFPATEKAHKTSLTKLSVIIPFWNEERYIEQAIQSVLSENLDSFEVICVDDNSEDGSPALVRELSAKHPEIRLVSNSGKGVSDARNTGLAFSRGEYVAFLDADDIVTNGSLKRRAKALDANPNWPMVHSEVQFTNETGRALGCGMGLPRTVSFKDSSTMPAHFNTVLIRRSKAHELSFPTGVKNGEDWLAFAQFLRHGHNSHFVDVPGGAATYRIHSQSTVLQDYPKHEESLKSVLDWVFSPDSDEEYAEEFRTGLDAASLPSIMARRKATVLFWEILRGDASSAEKIAVELSNSPLATGGDWKALAPSLEVVGIRFFGCHKNDLTKLCADETRSFSQSLASASAVLGPEFQQLFQTVFGIEPSRMSGFELSRDKRAGVDETGVVANLLQNRTGRDHTMLDVGAHFGTSAQFFHDLDWTIHCFEPDPNNRVKLLDRFRGAAQVIIDTRAVSDVEETGVKFFTSDQSTGISGLHAFHETHAETGLVDITTLTKIISDRQIESVDFLKIDVEGFDLNVLKGMPWQQLQPDVIECEFEDAKTLPLGHDWKTIADYLKQRGYAVYVSEWHPIIRYGIPHDWRRVFRYPSLQMADDAWGNLLAFKEDPGLEAVANAFSAEMKFRAPAPNPIVSASQVSKTEPSVTENSTISIRQTEGDQLNQNFVESRVPMLKKTPGYESQRIHESAYSVDDASPGNAWYSGFAHQIRRVSPGAFDFLRFLRRSVVHIVRKPFLLAAGLIALAGFIWILFSPALEAQRGWVVMGAVSIALLAGLIYVAHRSQYHAEKLHLKSAKLRRDLASLEGRLANAQILIAHEARGDMVKHVDHVLNASVLPKLESVAHISKDVAELKQEGRQTQNVIDESINRLKEANLRHNQELTRSLEKLSRTLTGVQSSHSDLSANMRNELEALTGKFASGEENLVTLQEKIDELASATSRLDLHNGEHRELIEMLEKQNQAEGEKLADLGEQVERELSGLKEQIEVHSQATVSLTGGLEQVSRTITETGDLTSQEIKSLAGDLDKLTEQLAERKEHSDAERDALKSQLDEQTQASESISRALAASERWNAYDNTQWFQHFNRKLKQDHIDTLRKDWQKRLSLKLQPQTLGYMAARACDIERQLDGRLATTIEDMLLRTLVARAVKSKSVHVLEIGTLFGTSSAIIFDALKPHFDNIHLSLLDPLDGYYNRAEPDILTGQVVDEETLRRNLSRVGVEDDQITLIKQLSTDPDAIEAAGQQQYDVLVIDGDHSYAGVKADFENYVEFVKLGGYIVFDDYGSPDWPDIKRYVDTELENHPTVTAVGSSWHTSVYRVVKPIARKNEKKTTAG